MLDRHEGEVPWDGAPSGLRARSRTARSLQERGRIAGRQPEIHADARSRAAGLAWRRRCVPPGRACFRRESFVRSGPRATSAPRGRSPGASPWSAKPWPSCGSGGVSRTFPSWFPSRWICGRRGIRDATFGNHARLSLRAVPAVRHRRRARDSLEPCAVKWPTPSATVRSRPMRVAMEFLQYRPLSTMLRVLPWTAGGELFSFNCADLADWPAALERVLRASRRERLSRPRRSSPAGDRGILQSLRRAGTISSSRGSRASSARTRRRGSSRWSARGWDGPGRHERRCAGPPGPPADRHHRGRARRGRAGDPARPSGRRRHALRRRPAARSCWSGSRSSPPWSRSCGVSGSRKRRRPSAASSPACPSSGRRPTASASRSTASPLPSSRTPTTSRARASTRPCLPGPSPPASPRPRPSASCARCTAHDGGRGAGPRPRDLGRGGGPRRAPARTSSSTPPDGPPRGPRARRFPRGSGPGRTSRTSPTSRASAGTTRRDRCSSRAARRAGAGAFRSRSGSRSASCWARTTRPASGARRKSGSSAPSRPTPGSPPSPATREAGDGRGDLLQLPADLRARLRARLGHGGRRLRLRRPDALARRLPRRSARPSCSPTPWRRGSDGARSRRRPSLTRRWPHTPTVQTAMLSAWLELVAYLYDGRLAALMRGRAHLGDARLRIPQAAVRTRWSATSRATSGSWPAGRRRRPATAVACSAS